MLFEGDVGSGKSTILLAIEFALFGLGDIDGRYLLRHGERTGFVLLDFEVNGREYRVYRSLERKGDGVNQREGYIVEDGVRTDYAVGEMKTRVLEILNFNERPRPKTSSVIYRYAIFTPQETMKEVLLQPVERRLETLRRAFKIEDYSTVANNASIILVWLDKEIAILSRQTQDIEEKISELDGENRKNDEHNGKLEGLLKESEEIKEEQGKILEAIEKLQVRKESVQRLETELPLLEKDVQGKVKLRKETEKRIEQLKKELAEIKEAEELLATVEPQYKEYSSKKTRLEEIEPSVDKYQRLIGEKEKLSEVIEKEAQHLKDEIRKVQKELDDLLKKIFNQKPATLEIPKLEKTEGEIVKEVSELQSISKRLVSLVQIQSRLQQDIRNKQEDSGQLEVEWDELKKIGIGAPCPKCKQKLTERHYDKVEQGYKSQLETLANKIEELSKKEMELGKQTSELTVKESELQGRKDQLGEIRQKLAALKKQEESIAEKENEYRQKEELVDKVRKSLAEGSYSQGEREKLAQTVVELEGLAPLEKEYDKIRAEIKGYEKENIEEKYHRSSEKISKKDTVSDELKESQSKVESLEKEIKAKAEELNQKKASYDAEKGVLQEIKQLDDSKKEVEEKREKKNIEIAAKKKDIENSEKEIKRIGGEIEIRKGQVLKHDALGQYKLWLNDFFIPAVKTIESHVMANINDEFNTLFQRWFGYLLETGDIAVRVDDNFTPLIEQNGYEIDVASLSGGEKTSVALAYRLALNVMVKKVCQAMSSNLLILDEPTDGFSREQLFRLRDILSELKCEQVIMVSHERELEGFVDKIYRIRKEAGESKIETIA
jgi:exonuclease SbcC